MFSESMHPLQGTGLRPVLITTCLHVGKGRFQYKRGRRRKSSRRRFFLKKTLKKIISPFFLVVVVVVVPTEIKKKKKKVANPQLYCSRQTTVCTKYKTEICIQLAACSSAPSPSQTGSVEQMSPALWCHDDLTPVSLGTTWTGEVKPLSIFH